MKRVSVFLFAFLIVSLVLSLFQIPKVKAAADWTTPDAVHSKCGEYGPSPATNAKDDDTGTYWRHSATCYHWIIFDMGETKAITKIRLYQASNEVYRFGYTSGLYVYVSDDPEAFGDAVWEGVLNTAGWQESGAFEKSGRYVKVLSKHDYTGQRMYEFDAYAETGAGATTKNFYGLINPQFTINHASTWSFNRYTQLNPTFTLNTLKSWQFNVYSMVNSTFTINDLKAFSFNLYALINQIFTVTGTYTSGTFLDFFGSIIQQFTVTTTKAFTFNRYAIINEIFTITGQIETPGLLNIYGLINIVLNVFGGTDLVVPTPEEEVTTFGTLGLVVGIIALAIAIVAFTKKS